MPVIKERTADPSEGARLIRSLQEKVALYPTVGQSLIDPFAVKNPRPTKDYIRWVASDKVQKRISQGFETVPVSEAADYGIPRYEVKTDRIERQNMILMRCPLAMYEARMAGHELRTRQNAGEEVRAFQNASGLTAEALEGIAQGRGRRKVVNRRPETLPVGLVLETGSPADLAEALSDD